MSYKFSHDEKRTLPSPKVEELTGKNKELRHVENIDNLRNLKLNEIEDCPEKSNQNLPKFLQEMTFFFRKSTKGSKKKNEKYKWANLEVQKVLNILYICKKIII